nr:RNA-directed DNA polymerase, eukaryota [Tanacetum cinerariifolium]
MGMRATKILKKIDAIERIKNNSYENLNDPIVMEKARSNRYMSDFETSKISLQSKFDQISKISKSVFISNFPDDCTNRDLWKVCNDYGTVVDVFIPNKKSKAGKHFAFVRFIKVLNFDRLIENLKSIWTGRFHLSVNPARFDWPKAPTFQKDKPVSSGNVTGFRQPNVQYHGGSNVTISTPPILLKPTLVLDDSCLVNRDLVNCVIGLGSKAKKDWIRELISKHKVSFLSIQETKMESVSAMEVKFLWGNYFFDHIISEACGNSGGILCTWDTNFFKKEQHIISDNFVALYRTWISNKQKLLLISVYAPQSVSSKLRCIEERWGSVFNVHGANAFNSFISNSGLNDIQLEGYSFTWAHPSATKMNGDWIDDPDLVKQEFRSHFADRFQDPGSRRGSLNFLFLNRLSNDQILDLESPISKDEIRTAVTAVEWFFEHGDFAIGCNSSFVSLIPKVLDPKVVSDYRPIILIGSLYKVVTKILTTRLFLVISDLISDVQIAFLPNRQILDGPFIINEILAWCKLKKQQSMIFKVDFAKAYNSIRWDFLDDVLISFGFGSKWRSWIRGSVGIPDNCVAEAAKSIGCSIMKAPFKYLRILVGDNMSSIKAWDEAISKMKKMLSRWKLNTLSVGGRLTLLKSYSSYS